MCVCGLIANIAGQARIKWRINLYSNFFENKESNRLISAPQSLDLLWMTARGYDGCMVNLSFRQFFPEMFAGFSINKGLYSWLRWLIIKILWVLSRIDRLLRLCKLFSIQPVEPWQFSNQDLVAMVVMMMFVWHFHYHKGLPQESGKNKSHYSHLHLV